MVPVSSAPPELPTGPVSRVSQTEHSADTPAMCANSVEKGRKRVGAFPLVDAGARQIYRAVQLRVPLRDFTQDGVFPASVRAAPSEIA